MIKQAVGVLLLIGGLGAGIVLVNQPQLLGQKAADNLVCPAGVSGVVCDDCSGNKFCNKDTSLTCEGWKFTNCHSSLCTIACTAGEFCRNGTSPCEASVYATDLNNCGGPNIRCGSGFYCSMGKCITETGDINNDKSVNILDIGMVINNYNKIPIINSKADINKDTSVDILDIGMVIDNYGK